MSTLNENILKVKETFQNIAAAIEEKGVDVGECDSPVTYADKIRSISGSVEGGFDINKLYVEAYETDAPEPSASVSSTEDGGVMITFGLRRGATGPQGPQGPQGPAGEQGPAGKDGDGTSGTRFEFLYTRVASEDVEVVAPDSVNEDGYEPTGWSLYPKGVTDDLQVEYVCQREKEDGIWGKYSDPAIWAMYGKIGRDGNGIEYIYKLTKDETVNPGQPVAPSNILPESYPSDWSDDPLSVSETETICWVSTRKQYYDENNEQYWGDYSKPTVWAKYGKDGKEGGGRTIFMFTANNDATVVPDTPSSSEISWDPDTNTITTISGSIWKPNTDEVTGKYIWLTNASFNSSGTLLNPGWSVPVKITGDDGVAGTDGLTTEFIYRLISNEDNFKQLVEYLSENPLEITDTDIVPETKDDICKSAWTDSPLGIDGVKWSMEVTCVRTKQEDGKWSKWNGPIRWAVWGEDGIDGDGVEYIFKVTPADVKNTTITDGHLLHIPSKSWYDDNGYGEYYQLNEFYPGNSEKWPAELDLDWTDEPRDVGPHEPLEWVSIRRKIDGVWGDFSSPKLWAKYTEDGYAYKTSYVFTRSNDKPAIPVDGADTDFDNPIPVDPTGVVTWNDTVPSGSSQVWMSYKTFCGNKNTPIDTDWSAPMLMQDRNDFQVEYSTKEAPVTPKGLQTYFDLLVKGGNLEPTSEEVEAAFREENMDWSDEATAAIWMATASYKNGVWTEWNVTRIKGEKGDTGAAGTGITIRGSFTYDQLVTADAYFANQTGSKPTPYFKDDKLETGDCYMIISGTNEKGEDVTGHMFVYDGSGNTFADRWLDAGLVKGDPGQSMYLYMAFADVYGTVKTLDGGSIDPNGGKYVGYKISDGVLDKDILLEWDTYTWSKWNGDDGFGVEQIFLLTSKNSKYNEDVAPAIPTDTNIAQDYCPNHGLGSDAYGVKWSDSPQNVSENYPYQWVVSRKWDGVNEYPWKGSTDDKGVSTGFASLYNRYAYDGNGAYRLALSQDYFLVPCEEDGTVDPEFKGPVQTSMSLFIGDDPVLDGVTYTAEGYNVVDGILTLTTEQIKALPVITQIRCEAKYGENKPVTATFTIEKTQNAYNINPQVLTIKKDPETLRPTIDSFNVNVYRWNGTGWSSYSGYLHVDFNRADGSADMNELFVVDEGEVNIAINNKTNLESIKLYLSENAKYYEKVDVIMDGKDGTPGESAWAWRLTDPIEMVSYNSDGTLNGTLNSTTTVLANYGGKIANVTVNSVREINETIGCVIDHDGAIVTLKELPDGTDVKNFNFIIKATGTYIDDNNITHTDTAELTYTVKKWFGEAPTAMVHLSNNSTPVPTDSDGVYTNDVIRTAELTASSGINPIAITNVTCNLDNVTASLDGNELTVTVETDADWSGSDVLAVPIICTLDGDYPDQTVTMNFYKVRATGKAEYPDVYDLFVSPNSIFVKVDQTTGMGVYESNTITPTIRKYGADNSTTDLTVKEFIELNVGQLSYAFDGSKTWDPLEENEFIVNNGAKDADEYIDVKLTIGDWEQVERVKVSHGQIPNIDWELVLDCPERIPYDYEGNIKITAPTVACKLCKNINGTPINVTECPANFDIVYELDGVRAENGYKLGDEITLDSFNNTCEFILVNQGDESNEQDEVYDRKLVTKEYDAEPGKSGSTPIIYPAGDFDIAKAINGEYVGNSNQAPYVFYNVDNDYKGFYIAYGTPKAAPFSDNIIKKDKEVDWTNIPTDAANWIEMNNFSAIYSDIGVLKHALVGKWVFHGDYMFSQDGHLGNPESGSFGIAGAPGGNKYNGDECSYDLVVQRGISFGQIPDQENEIKKWPLYQHIEFGSWVPNIWFNAKTGAGRLGDGLEWDNNGDVTFNKPFFYKEIAKTVRDTILLTSELNNKNIIVSENTSVEDPIFDQYLLLKGATSSNGFTFRITNKTNNMLLITGAYFSYFLIGDINEDSVHDSKRTGVYLYPHSSCDFTVYSYTSEDHLNDTMYLFNNPITVNSPLWQTKVNGSIVGCNGVSTVGYKYAHYQGVCTQIPYGTPVFIGEGCNFTHFVCGTSLQQYPLYYQLYKSNGEYVLDGDLNDINVSDSGQWVEIPKDIGSDFKMQIYYGSLETEKNVNNCDMEIMFRREDAFAGIASVNFNHTPSLNFGFKNFNSKGYDSSLLQLYVPNDTTKIHVAVLPSGTTYTDENVTIPSVNTTTPIATDSSTKMIKKVAIGSATCSDVRNNPDYDEDNDEYLETLFVKPNNRSSYYTTSIHADWSNRTDHVFGSTSTITKTVNFRVDPYNDRGLTKRCADVIFIIYRNDTYWGYTRMRFVQYKKTLYVMEIKKEYVNS